MLCHMQGNTQRDLIVDVREVLLAWTFHTDATYSVKISSLSRTSIDSIYELRLGVSLGAKEAG